MAAREKKKELYENAFSPDLCVDILIAAHRPYHLAVTDQVLALGIQSIEMRGTIRIPRFLSPGSVGFSSPMQTLFSTQRFFSPGQPDFYAVLGVSPTSTTEEIKGAYKKLALELHPDRNKAKDAEEKFKQVSEAYSVIGNKSKRQEYDAQRQFMGASSARGGSGTYESPNARGFSPQGGFAGAGNVRTMSTADADKLFRELFGNVNIDQIFREFEQQSNSKRSGLGEKTQLSRRFGSFGSQSTFNPFFSQSSSRVYTDGSGNTREESEFVDQFGRTFRVARDTSTQENARVNTDPDEFMRAAATRDPLGRVKTGATQFTFGRRGFSNDFFESYFGVRSHGRGPIVSVIVILCWVIIITGMLYATFEFLGNHPMVLAAIVVLVYMRKGRYRLN